MLSETEKEALYQTVVTVFGEDHSLRQYKNGFNERTVQIVEQMIDENRKCNQGMKELVEGLLGGATQTLTKGWLKKILKFSKKKLEKTELKGQGCLVSVKYNYKKAIIASTI